MINLNTKLESFSFTHSKDMAGPKKLKKCSGGSMDLIPHLILSVNALAAISKGTWAVKLSPIKSSGF